VDLSRPLAVVTPTLDAAVLQALAATTAWASGAQVHRLAGAGSSDGVRKVLARLVDQGIVLADEHPHAILYVLNRDHVAAGPIVALTRLRADIVNRIATAVAGWQPPLLHASLFGSFARGEATTASDIDVLLVLAPDVAGDLESRTTQLDRLAADIRAWTGNRAQIIAITLETLSAMITDDDPLVGSWRTDHVHLTGTRLLNLLRGARAS
jgi:predicted nucleotidyltransferase